MLRTMLIVAGAAFALALPQAQAQAPAQMRAAPATGSAALELFADSLALPDPAAARPRRGTFYAPSYSSLFAGSGRTRIDFAVTLSVHNVSPDKHVVLDKVAYYDTAGRRIENHLERPVALKPFGTIQFFVPKDDLRGGTGANFVVEWSSVHEDAEAPHVETVMIGIGANQSLAFAVPARPIGGERAR